MLKKILSWTVVICFFLTTLGPICPIAWSVEVGLNLPAPGTMVNLSPAYEPVMIKGLTVNKDNPFLFDFIVDVGQDHMSGGLLKKEGEKLIKYFLASLAIPDKDVWVNLSPYERNRIIPETLGQTEMGRDLLEQDYILKQITASLIYPEKQLGKSFWDKVYAKSQQMYGTTQIPVNTFNKVWIMADRAEVFEHNQTAFVVDSHLKVMLEEDYLALTKNQMPSTKSPANNSHEITSKIIKKIILPELEQEVNTGKNFANLRQIFNSIILSSWYKKNLKQALLNQVYANQSKINGIDLNNPSVKEQIYEQYLKAYKKGVFNYIKEEVNTNGTMIPRKYFSGGISRGVATPEKLKVSSDQEKFDAAMQAENEGRLVTLETNFVTSNPDAAMNTHYIDIPQTLTIKTIHQNEGKAIGSTWWNRFSIDLKDKKTKDQMAILLEKTGLKDKVNAGTTYHSIQYQPKNYFEPAYPVIEILNPDGTLYIIQFENSEFKVNQTGEPYLSVLRQWVPQDIKFNPANVINVNAYYNINMFSNGVLELVPGLNRDTLNELLHQDLDFTLADIVAGTKGLADEYEVTIDGFPAVGVKPQQIDINVKIRNYKATDGFDINYAKRQIFSKAIDAFKTLFERRFPSYSAGTLSIGDATATLTIRANHDSAMTTEDRVKLIIGHILSKNVSVDDSLVNLGMDSLKLVEIVMALEDEFGIQIPDEDHDKFITVGDVINYINQRYAAMTVKRFTFAIDGHNVREVTQDPQYLAATEKGGAVYSHRGYRVFLFQSFNRNEPIIDQQEALLKGLAQWVRLPADLMSIKHDISDMARANRFLFWISPKGELSAFREDSGRPFSPRSNLGLVLDPTFRNADVFISEMEPGIHDRIANAQRQKVKVTIDDNAIHFDVPLPDAAMLDLDQNRIVDILTGASAKVPFGPDMVDMPEALKALDFLSQDIVAWIREPKSSGVQLSNFLNVPEKTRSSMLKDLEIYIKNQNITLILNQEQNSCYLTWHERINETFLHDTIKEWIVNKKSEALNMQHYYVNDEEHPSARSNNFHRLRKDIEEGSTVQPTLNTPHRRLNWIELENLQDGKIGLRYSPVAYALVKFLNAYFGFSKTPYFEFFTRSFEPDIYQWNIAWPDDRRVDNNVVKALGLWWVDENLSKDAAMKVNVKVEVQPRVIYPFINANNKKNYSVTEFLDAITILTQKLSTSSIDGWAQIKDVDGRGAAFVIMQLAEKNFGFSFSPSRDGSGNSWTFPQRTVSTFKAWLSSQAKVVKRGLPVNYALLKIVNEPRVIYPFVGNQDRNYSVSEFLAAITSLTQKVDSRNLEGSTEIRDVDEVAFVIMHAAEQKFDLSYFPSVEGSGNSWSIPDDKVTAFKQWLGVQRNLVSQANADADAAMLMEHERNLKSGKGTLATATNGGIDLNTSNGMQWKVSRDGQGVQMNVDPSMVARIQREGINWLSPVIFKITPVTSVWTLIGLQAPAQAGHLAGL